MHYDKEEVWPRGAEANVAPHVARRVPKNLFTVEPLSALAGVPITHRNFDAKPATPPVNMYNAPSSALQYNGVVYLRSNLQRCAVLV
jgi:hypothetical protein